MNAIHREFSDRIRAVSHPATDDGGRAARAAALRAYRLTRTALPAALPTRMPPQQFEFWHTPLVDAVRGLRRRFSGRRTLPGSADVGAG